MKQAFSLSILIFLLCNYPLSAISDSNEDWPTEANFYKMAKKRERGRGNRKIPPALVSSTREIPLPEFPKAHNPSIIKVDLGFLLIFRYIPEPSEPWISYTGIVLLNDKFEKITEPELLNIRQKNDKTPSQAEDARLFSYKKDLYLIYNDNLETINPNNQMRRDMYIAKLNEVDGHFSLSPAIKLIHEEKYFSVLCQKNWVPFEWEGNLLINYTIDPHEVLCPDFKTGVCHSLYATPTPNKWKWGELRGGAPAQLVDGEYLAFFHSLIVTASPSSKNKKMWHYFMGAYTFSSEPPFEITKISPSPITANEFYTYSNYDKRVIYPGGYVICGSSIYLAYGKDDSSIWIATIDKEQLMKTLISVR